MKLKNKEDKPKDMVYLSERPNRIIKLYPSSFDDKSLNVLEKHAINDKKIDYKRLSYMVLFYDEDNVTSHEINCLEKYGTLYDLLENLVTSKMNIDHANADQIGFIINLMQGYNKNDLFDHETFDHFCKYNVLNKAKKSLQLQKNARRVIKCFFPKSFEKNIDKDQKKTLLNAMSLWNDINMIINLFDNKNIEVSDYP